MVDYLEIQCTSFPEQKEHFNDLIDCLTKKLWHQLGGKLTDVIKLEFFQSEQHTINLFESVAKKFAKNLNQQTYVNIAIAASRQQKDKDASLAFLNGVGETVKEDVQASLLCSMEIARLNIQLDHNEEAKKLLADGKASMDSFMGIMEASVQSHVFLASAEYYKAYGPAAEYYKNTLLYLTYTPLESIPAADQMALAADVSLAAVVGEGIYNFGELLQHPVVTKLYGTPQQWISDLLLSLNRGDIASFRTTLAEKSGSEPRLKKAEAFLDEKIRIMALIEMVFGKDAHARNISFQEVAATCKCAPDQVEHLLMKTFSLGVLKGTIDQVEGTVRVKCVQARVLDLKQLASIRDRLTQWSGQLSEAATYLESNAPELLAGQ